MTSTPRIISVTDIPALDPATVVDALRESFRALATGRAVQPTQTVLGLDGGGDIISYPTLDLDAGIYAVKLSPYIPRSEGALVTAWTLLFDVTRGEPIALIDSKALTTLRTAATTALAVDLLASPDASTIAIVGSGAVARTHVDYLRAVRPSAQLRMHTRTPTELEVPGVEVVHGVEGATDADVIALCTSAAAAVIDASQVAPGALITSLSTNAPGAHEIDPALLGDLDVYTDYRASTGAVPDFTAAQATGWSVDRILGDLPELVTGTSPAPSGTRPVFFRSIGLGIEDAAIAGVVTRLLGLR
ncbi:ornithine cyclodeaminase family protein [Salinibacterium sp. G-O1]|uniref:ornithine cyclodeaminase family protein n=1 Tax=Salinibacterium sp. G-O1 TaxID=3046208 RepID=UPI0024BA6B8E|nr:ornithine cyclodeaminase family protein [Salinibacterium sp. G-O1]MDJ0336337.1 ornithine cyclodeaminase family protein [Salinibacterium sp. G-O1]